LHPWDGAEALPGTFAHPPVHASEREHQTEKPLALMEEVVRIAPPAALVLDPFCGSGAAGMACIRRGRRFLGCELSEGYAGRARGRLAAEEVCSTLAARRLGQCSLFTR
jgi:site-specific DNA-methyltransferase (adenine-specific)